MVSKQCKHNTNVQCLLTSQYLNDFKVTAIVSDSAFRAGKKNSKHKNNKEFVF